MEASIASAELQVQRKRGRPPRETGGILEAAIAVFAREGYSAATIEMIAAEASASTATLYKRFTNKHGLFVAVLQKISDRSLEIHIDNGNEPAHAFTSLINRLQAHAITCTDPQVRGVLRTWISEVRNHTELSELFAVNAGSELVEALVDQIKELQAKGMLKMAADDPHQINFAAQTMLGVLERFTLMRGLVLGDNSKPIFSSRGIAEQSVHAMMGMWGTQTGMAAFHLVPKTKLIHEKPDRTKTV